jgi:hypothetical protein
MPPVDETYAEHAERSTLRSLKDPRVLERIREAENRVRNGGPEDDEALMSAEELESVIADLRAGRRPGLLEDQES